jgi:hypothetical protein
VGGFEVKAGSNYQRIVTNINFKPENEVEVDCALRLHVHLLWSGGGLVVLGLGL